MLTWRFLNHKLDIEKGVPNLQRSTRYTSYLLRLWQMQNDQQTTWVASVQSTVTGEQRSFPSVGALLEFLQAEFGRCEPVGDAAPHSRSSLNPSTSLRASFGRGAGVT